MVKNEITRAGGADQGGAPGQSEDESGSKAEE